MNKIFFAFVKLATAYVQQSFAQDATSRPQLSPLLQLYNNSKDASVRGDATEASTKAKEFIKTAIIVYHADLCQQTRYALLKDAEAISATWNKNHQREHFVNFSKNIGALAKTVKLSFEMIYEAYCPREKVYWLSNEQAVKNLYYGRAMLKCGSIKDTLK